MKRLVRGRARLIAIVVALVVVATAASCAGGAGGNRGGGTRVSKPVITPKEAAAVAMKLQANRVATLDSDGSALASIETEPQLTFDQDGIQQVRAQGGSVIATPFASVTAMVPKQTRYPAWFMAIGQGTNGQTALDLLSRASQMAPWQLVVQTSLNSGPIDWKQLSGGWAVSTDLNVDPSRTLADYWNSATSGASTTGAGVASGTLTSGIASDVESKVATAKSGGWAQAAGFAAGGALPEAVQLRDGSSLSFAWVIEQLKTRDAYDVCFPQPASNGLKWDPLVPNGNYLEVDLTYTYLEGMATPPSGDLLAVSYAAGTTGVDTTPCSS